MLKILQLKEKNMENKDETAFGFDYQVEPVELFI